MKVLSVLSISVVSLLLAGCKASVQTKVSLSELLKGETKTIPSALYVEVASCNDYQDSRKPSSSLVDVQKQIPQVFTDATYVECFRQKMESFASFSVPVYLDKDDDGKLASNDHLNLTSNESVLLAITVPQGVKDRMDQARKKGMGISLDMSVIVKVTNDTGADVPLAAISTFIDNKPVIYGDFTVPNSANFTLRTSDVSVQTALASQTANVLFHSAKKDN